MNPDKFQNKYRIPSARAVWHDYNGGEYFITICTAHRKHYFGKIQNGEMIYTAIGQYAFENLQQLKTHFPYCEIPLFVVMPNHIHAIFICKDDRTDDRTDDVYIVSTKSEDCRTDDVHIVSTGETHQRLKNALPDEKMQSISHKRGRLSTAIGGFKRAVTYYANQNKLDFGWQTRFHDHIIRNQNEMNLIANYIVNNPIKWENDKFFSSKNSPQKL